MNTLNLVYVKYFCDAVKLGSVAEAAKANFVTQSAISQGIAKLESALNISLLVHQPNRFKVTAEGEALFKEFIDLLTHAKSIQGKISGGKLDYIGDLVFSCTYSFALAVIPKYLKKFMEEYPHVKIKFSLSSPDTLKNDIKKGNIDFGILPDEENLDKFSKKIIHSGHFKFYSKPGLRKNTPFKLITTEDNSKETTFLRRSLLKKMEFNDSFQVDSWEMIAKLASLGLGIGYLPDYFADERANDLPLQEFKIKLKTEKYQMAAICAKETPLRKSSEIFLSYF